MRGGGTSTSSGVGARSGTIANDEGDDILNNALFSFGSEHDGRSSGSSNAWMVGDQPPVWRRARDLGGVFRPGLFAGSAQLGRHWWIVGGQDTGGRLSSMIWQVDVPRLLKTVKGARGRVVVAVGGEGRDDGEGRGAVSSIEDML